VAGQGHGREIGAGNGIWHFSKEAGVRVLSIGFLAISLVMGMVVRCSPAAIAIDFEEQPLADLSTITNVYHGDATFLYVFLVIGPDSLDRSCTHVSGYDLGYRLICSDNDIINHGFYRQADWRHLDARDTDPSLNVALPGTRTPAAIGYWKLELKNGRGSRGEFQIVPNPENGSTEVTLFDGNQQPAALRNEELSQDTRCHGTAR
jgi:hypothetical protein